MLGLSKKIARAAALSLFLAAGSLSFAQHGTQKVTVAKNQPPVNTASTHSASLPAQPKKSFATASEIWDDLIKGNARFVSGRSLERELIPTRQELAKGQHPQTIVLSCADSRVGPELIFDKNLGDLFVVRTAGNIADPVGLGSIEYAAEHLHSKLLVVLGHENCGAVAAAASAWMTGEKLPTANLQAIVEKIFPALETVKSCALGSRGKVLQVESNVFQSAKDIVANSPIVRQELNEGKLTIIRAVYNMDTGEVRRID